MKPSEKSPEVDKFLTSLFGADRREVIKKNECMPPPIGCGKPIENFESWSPVEQSEYQISGLCRDCQVRSSTPNTFESALTSIRMHHKREKD